MSNNSEEDVDIVVLSNYLFVNIVIFAQVSQMNNNNNNYNNDDDDDIRICVLLKIKRNSLILPIK